MLKILIVAATEIEISLIKENIQKKNFLHLEVTYCISGVGTAMSAYHISKAIFQHQPNFVLQVGIGGAFLSKNIKIGDVVFVHSDCFADLGVEDKEQFISAFELGLVTENVFPFTKDKLLNSVNGFTSKIHLPTCKGISVNKASGDAKSIQQLMNIYDADVESMEGAGCHYVCLNEGVCFAQIRAISNFIEPRNKANWQIETALKNLNIWLIKYLEELNETQAQ